MNFRNKKIIFVCLSLVAAIPAYGIDDNLTIFNRLTKEIAREVLQHMELNENSSVLIKNIDSANTQGWFIENHFYESLKEMGCDSVVLYRDQPAPFGARSVIEFKLIEIGMTYQRLGSFWRTRSIRRDLAMELWAQVLDGANGLVLWSGTIEKTYSDQIEPDRLQSIENKTLAFTTAPIPPPVRFQKIIEPAVIVGLTGTVVYLFYSLRSK